MLTEVEIFKENLDVSRVTLIVTIVLAVTTVVFSALTMAFQRSHNKKTVRPLCSIRKCTKDSNMIITVKNAGLGPMRDCCITINNPDNKPISFSELHNYTLMPNETIELLDLVNTEVLSLTNVTLKIQYSDLYDQYYEHCIELSSL